MRFPSKRNALQFLRDAGLEFGTIIDVGVMTETRELREAFPDHRHVLFEPDDQYADAIYRNYRGMNFSLAPIAVSDLTGPVPLRLGHRQEALVQEATTLDDYLVRDLERSPYLLKIDVDGDELRVIRGATHALTLTHCVIIEVQPRNWLERQGALEAVGFRVIDLVDICYYHGAFSQADLVMVRSDVIDATPALSPFRHNSWDFANWSKLENPTP